MIMDFKIKTQEIQEFISREDSGDTALVPITTNILEKNGFCIMIDTCKIDTYRYNREGIGIYIFMFSKPEITIIKQDSFLIRNLRLQYVHQLQYVLRMCGMDDLANNFKY
jgi:hypothetical protein